VHAADKPYAGNRGAELLSLLHGSHPIRTFARLSSKT
jgi:hypothetical protein